MQTEKLDAILESFVAVGGDTKDKILGAAFIVVNKDGILYQGSAGRTGMAAGSPRFTVDSFTWIASMTKFVTAAGAMQIVERGVIDLDQDVRPLLPKLSRLEILRGFEPGPDGTEAPITEPNTKPVTLRQLLTHTSGVGYDAADPELARWSKAVGRTASALDYTLEGWTTPLKFVPGESWWYGAGIEWAAQAILAALGAAGSRNADASGPPSLDVVLEENMFGPLGMRNTTFFPRRTHEELLRNRIEDTARDPTSGSLSAAALPVPIDPPMASGGSGLWSTCADHAKLMRAILWCSEKRESLNDAPARILKPETVAEMLRPQLDEKQHAMLNKVADDYHDTMVPDFDRGVPLDHGICGIINLEDIPGKRRAGSMMWKGSANGQWWIDPKAGIAATLLVNVFPPADSVVVQLHDELERALYSGLENR